MCAESKLREHGRHCCISALCAAPWRRSTPKPPGPTMKIFRNTATFEEPWESVTAAFWRKYSPENPYTGHVESARRPLRIPHARLLWLMPRPVSHLVSALQPTTCSTGVSTRPRASCPAPGSCSSAAPCHAGASTYAWIRGVRKLAFVVLILHRALCTSFVTTI